VPDRETRDRNSQGEESFASESTLVVSHVELPNHQSLLYELRFQRFLHAVDQVGTLGQTDSRENQDYCFVNFGSLFSRRQTVELTQTVINYSSNVRNINVRSVDFHQVN
jgi:hypothetical protein